MREVKEKSPLKACAAETLKFTPQTAFRRGADASFQQLRQELREAAQDGQMEDRYESGKITETADHTVRQAEHLAERAIHKQPKARSAPRQEGRTEFKPQHECPHPQQPAAAPREYPPVSAQPSYPPQSQPQVNRSIRKSASPIKEKRVLGADTPQPKVRETAQPIQETVAPIKEKPVQQRGTPLRKEAHGELSAWNERKNVPHRAERPKDIGKADVAGICQ